MADPEENGRNSQDENRVAVRRRSLLGGRVFNNDGDGWDCLIRDLSSTGAKLRCEAPLAAGTQVDLRINKFDEICRAEVVWQRGDEMGLRFVGRFDAPSEAMQRFFTLVNTRHG